MKYFFLCIPLYTENWSATDCLDRLIYCMFRLRSVRSEVFNLQRFIPNILCCFSHVSLINAYHFLLDMTCGFPRLNVLTAQKNHLVLYNYARLWTIDSTSNPMLLWALTARACSIDNARSGSRMRTTYKPSDDQPQLTLIEFYGPNVLLCICWQT